MVKTPTTMKIARSFALSAALVVSLVAAFAAAESVEKKAARDNRLALELYDLGEYQPALAKLKATLAMLNDKGLGVRPVAAQSHLYMGLVYARGLGKDKKALEHFHRAAELDEDVTLPKGRADEITTELFEKAYEKAHPTIDCSTLMGVAHTQLVTAKEGEATRIEAKIGKVLEEMSTMYVRFRGPDGGDFQEVSMEQGVDCTVAAEIPADAVAAPRLEYYLVGKLEDGRLAAQKGKADSPFEVAVSFGASTMADLDEDDPTDAVEENPIDEVPEGLAPKKPDQPKGSGCAGCAASSGLGGGSALLVVLVALLLTRRRRLC